MQAYVYTDKSLERYAGRFVWLSINTEEAKNAEFLDRYKIAVLPTQLILDPKRERITARYVGGLTAGQLARLLDDTLARSTGSAADQALAEADKLASDGKHEEAAKLYARALSSAPKSWSRYRRAAESYILALSLARQHERCASEARRLYPGLKGSTSAANVASTGLSCAIALDAKHLARPELISILDEATQEAFDDPRIEVSADDRSGLYIALIDAREAGNDEEGARKLRGEWAAFLEKAASAARTPEQRAVYDSHRLSVYLDLGTPEKAIPMLEQSARDFPDDYNPHARLAIAYRAMKQYEKALESSQRAGERAYGPRKLTILRTRADIYTEKGDKEAARKTIAEAIDHARSLPKAQRRESTIAALEKRLSELSP